MQKAKMDASLKAKMLQGRLEVMTMAKGGEKLPVTLMHQDKPPTTPLTSELAITQKKKPLEANAIKVAQIAVNVSEKDFIADWGGELVITSRKIFATDVPSAPLTAGDKGPTLIRVSALTPNTVRIPAPTVFFAKEGTAGPEARLVGSPSVFENFWSGWLWGNNRRRTRFISLGGGAMLFHDGYGNMFHQSVLHNSVKIIGKNSIEADSVSAKTDSNGKTIEYEERVVRLFRNAPGVVYAKLAFAKYNSERTLERQTLLEGWLSSHSNAADEITQITQDSWQQTAESFGL